MSRLPLFLCLTTLGCILLTAHAGEAQPSVATASNPSAFVKEDGTFQIRGIPAFAAWQPREDGTFFPGQPIQYLVRVTTAEGIQGQSIARFDIPLSFEGDPVVVTTPLIRFGTAIIKDPVRISSTVQITDLVFGQTVRMSTAAFDANGDWTDITTDNAIAYTSSNPLVAQVSHTGLISARKRGRPATAVITALYDGLASSVEVKVVNVIIDSDNDGMPDEYEILYGFNPSDSRDAAFDSDSDGLTNIREYEIGSSPLERDTDRDGLLDGFDYDPIIPESVVPVFVVNAPAQGQLFLPNDSVDVQAKATDNVKVVRIQAVINGIDAGAVNGDSISLNFLMGNFASVTEPEVTIVFYAWDINGNRGDGSVSVSLPRSNITIEKPYSGQIFAASETVNIVARGDGYPPVTHLRCVVNGIEIAAVDGAELSLSPVMSSLTYGNQYASISFYGTNALGEEIENSVYIQAADFVNAVPFSGRVVADGQPVAGAWIQVSDGSLVRSAADGTFVVVRAIGSKQSLKIMVWAEIKGRTQARELFLYGTTDDNGPGEWINYVNGDVDLTPAPTLTGQIGEPVASGQFVDLPFAIPFYGTDYTRLYIRAGQVSFGEDSTSTTDEGWLAGPPVVVMLGGPGTQPFAASSVPGSGSLGQFVRVGSDEITVTWLGLVRTQEVTFPDEAFPYTSTYSSQTSLQIVIKRDGSMQTMYGSNTYAYSDATLETTIGFYPGGGLGEARWFPFTNIQSLGNYSGSSDGVNPFRQTGLTYQPSYKNLVLSFTPSGQGGYVFNASRPATSYSDPSLSGRLLLGNQPLADALVTLSTGQSAVTDASGRFSFVPMAALAPIYVAGDAVPGGSGMSWSSAFQTIDQALAVASHGREIWIKAGSYSLTQGSVPFAVALYGGFTGTESIRAQRDWRANPTRIMNSSVILTSSYDVTLDGLVFDSTANVDVLPYLTLPAYSPLHVIRHCVFIHHKGSGAAAVEMQSGSRAVFEGCVFADNQDGSGTAVALSNSGMAMLSNCLFTGNDPRGPGSVIWSGVKSALSLSHCTVARNASGSNPAIKAEGRILIQNSVLNNEPGDGVADILGEGEVYDSLVSNWQGVHNGTVNPTAYPVFVGPDHPRGDDGLWGTADDGLALQGEHLVPDATNPDGPDGILGTDDDDMSLVVGSVGIDALLALNQVVDLAGCGRPAGSGGDIGAYETHAVALAVPENPRPYPFFSRIWDVSNLTLTVTDPTTGETYTIPNIGVMPNRSSDTGDVTIGQPAPNGVGMLIPTSDPNRPIRVYIAGRSQP